MGEPGFKSQLYPLTGLSWGHQDGMINKNVLYISVNCQLWLSCYSYCYSLFLCSPEVVYIIYFSLEQERESIEIGTGSIKTQRKRALETTVPKVCG